MGSGSSQLPPPDPVNPAHIQVRQGTDYPTPPAVILETIEGVQSLQDAIALAASHHRIGMVAVYEQQSKTLWMKNPVSPHVVQNPLRVALLYDANSIPVNPMYQQQVQQPIYQQPMQQAMPIQAVTTNGRYFSAVLERLVTHRHLLV